MDNLEMRQKLHHYIENAEEERLHEIFQMVKDEIKQSYDHWADDEFVAVLQEREEKYLQGTSKTYSVIESVSRAREAIRRHNK